MRKLKHSEAREAVPSGAMMINSMSNPRGMDFGLSILRDIFFPTGLYGICLARSSKWYFN